MCLWSSVAFKGRVDYGISGGDLQVRSCPDSVPEVASGPHTYKQRLLSIAKRAWIKWVILPFREWKFWELKWRVP